MPCFSVLSPLSLVHVPVCLSCCLSMTACYVSSPFSCGCSVILSFFEYACDCHFTHAICPPRHASHPTPLVCVLFDSRPPLSPHLPTDISVSLLAVVVGFCGLALLVVSLFVFWKLCWPIWRSKALSSHVDNCAQGSLPEAPPPMTSLPHQPAATETKVVLAGRLPSPQPPQKQREEEEKKRKVPEVKVNGRSSVKLLEAAMKISQTSPDIPAEVQQALHEHLTKQAKIQRQTTEPTSSSRYPFLSSSPLTH